MALQEKYPDAPLRILQEHHSGTGTTEDLEQILSNPDTLAATLEALEDIDNGKRKPFDDLQCDNVQQQPDVADEDVIAVGWKKKKRKDGLMSIGDATGMSEATVRKYAEMTGEDDFLKNRTRETSNGKKAIHLTQVDVNRLIAAKTNY